MKFKAGHVVEDDGIENRKCFESHHQAKIHSLSEMCLNISTLETQNGRRRDEK